MAFEFLKSIFGGGRATTAPNPTPQAAPPATGGTGSAGSAGGGDDVCQFVDFVVRQLVDAPESVKIARVTQGQETTVQITCEKRDIGKIIGKNGKTIAAIRALVSGVAGRSGGYVNVEVLD